MQYMLLLQYKRTLAAWSGGYLEVQLLFRRRHKNWHLFITISTLNSRCVCCIWVWNCQTCSCGFHRTERLMYLFALLFWENVIFMRLSISFQDTDYVYMFYNIPLLFHVCQCSGFEFGHTAYSVWIFWVEAHFCSTLSSNCSFTSSVLQCVFWNLRMQTNGAEANEQETEHLCM